MGMHEFYLKSQSFLICCYVKNDSQFLMKNETYCMHMMKSVAFYRIALSTVDEMILISKLWKRNVLGEEALWCLHFYLLNMTWRQSNETYRYTAKIINFISKQIQHVYTRICSSAGAGGFTTVSYAGGASSTNVRGKLYGVALNALPFPLRFDERSLRLSSVRRLRRHAHIATMINIAILHAILRAMISKTFHVPSEFNLNKNEYLYRKIRPYWMVILMSCQRTLDLSPVL